MTLLLTLAPAETAPRLGLGIGSGLALLAGIISLLRVLPLDAPPSLDFRDSQGPSA